MYQKAQSKADFESLPDLESSRLSHPRFGSALARAQGIDLRRRQGRERAELLVARAEFLDPADQALIYAVFRQGTSVAELARASGASARSLRSRLRSISQRVLSPAFATIVTGADHWPGPMRRVAIEVIVKGRTLRATAQSLHLSLATTRAHRQAALALIAAARPGAKP